MSKELFKNLLADFKKANKERKEKLAKKAGYNSSADYELFLSRMILDDTTLGNIPVEKPIIHIVDIVDCSGSMSGEKIRVAASGVNEGIKELQKVTDVIYKYTLCTFSYSDAIHLIYRKTDISNIRANHFKAVGYTALYDAIGKVFDEFREKPNDEKVLINIYTDGEENNSKIWTASSTSRLIEEGKDRGITVTFIGLQGDVDRVIANLKIEDSNTLVYNGTAAELDMAFGTTISARATYSMSVLAGEDVTKGFYKNIKK